MRPFRELKADALAALRGKWGIAVGAGLLAGLFGGAGSSFNLSLEVGDSEPISGQQAEELRQFFTENLTWILLAIAVACISGIAFSILVSSVVHVGYARFNLNLTAGGYPTVGTLFDGFRNWGAIVRATGLQSLVIFLKTLLFFIPGIMAMYDYAMVPYLLAENPFMGTRETLERSKAMMRGHRMELFLLELSFIGWAILAVFTLGIGHLWLNPYVEATRANFYYALSAEDDEAFFYQAV